MVVQTAKQDFFSPNRHVPHDSHLVGPVPEQHVGDRTLVCGGQQRRSHQRPGRNQPSIGSQLRRNHGAASQLQHSSHCLQLVLGHTHDV